MRIAAKHSFQIYGLEGPNPKFMVVLQDLSRGRLRSIEVGAVYGPFLDAQKLAEAQNLTKMLIC